MQAVRGHFPGVSGGEGLRRGKQGSRAVRKQAGKTPQNSNPGNPEWWEPRGGLFHPSKAQLPSVKHVLVQVEKPRFSVGKAAAQSPWRWANKSARASTLFSIHQQTVFQAS